MAHAPAMFAKPVTSALSKASLCARAVTARAALLRLLPSRFSLASLPPGFGRPASPAPGSSPLPPPPDAGAAPPSGGGGASASTGGGSGSGPGSGPSAGREGGKPGGKKPEGGDAWVSALFAVGAAMGIAYELRRVSRSSADISWQEFRNVYLSTGMVDHLEVVDRDLVRVHLRSVPSLTYLEGSLGGGGGGAGGAGGGGGGEGG